VFFGRDVFVEKLVEASQTRNFIPVLGASGSGKSSVVLAGLVPKLEKEGHWKFTHFRPSSGKNPFYALAEALVPLYKSELDSTDQMTQAGKLAKSLSKEELSLDNVFSNVQRRYPNHKVLLIVDQFEELYTEYSDLQFRRSFLDCLLPGFQSANFRSSSSIVLVATIRADFLANVLSYRPLADMLQNADIKLGAMSREELKEVIEKPAENLGVTFEAGLVERILNDVQNEPGNLALLEFTLTELWKKRIGKQITHDAYEEIGEVSGAITTYANKTLSEFKPEEQERVKRIFIQLVHPGEGTKDTKRVATKAELKESNWNLVKELADARLLVTNRTVITSSKNSEQETVELVHEALIRNWEQLKRWMEADREFRTWQERIRVTIGQWREMNRDKGLLLRGAALVYAQEQLEKHGEEISDTEKEFILLGRTYQRRSFQTTIGVVTIAFAIISGLALFWFFEKNKAIIAANNENIKAGIIRLKSNSDYKNISNKLRIIEVNRKLQQANKPTLNSLIQGVNLLRQSVYQVSDINLREINYLKGHQGGVNRVSFSRDGKYLASASTDNTVKLWRRDGELVKTLTGHDSKVNSVSFSPDGKYLASASRDGIVKLWRRDGELIKTLTGHQGGVNRVSFSQDGKYLASASYDKTVKLWRRDGELIKTLIGHQGSVNRVSFSRDGKYLASASHDKTVKLWTSEGKLVKTLTGHKDKVNSVSFSPDGKYLASASLDKTVKLWTSEGKLLKTLTGHEDQVKNVSFSPDSKYLASASFDTTVKLWTSEGELIKTLTGHDSQVNSVSFSPDGKYLASASWDGTVKLWTPKGELLDTLTGHQDYVYGVSFSADGKYLASASLDKTVKLWTSEGVLVDTLTGHQHYVYGVSFSRDGKYLASASRDGTVKLWTGDWVLVKALTGHQSSVKSVSFSPDRKYLASGSGDKTVKLWTQEGKLVKTLTGHQNGVNSVSFSADGKYLASGSGDKTVKLWTQEGELLQTLKGHQGHVYGVSFSPDGKYLASGSGDKTVKLWTQEGELLKTLSGHQDRVNSVSFSPDGKYLASGSSDTTVKLWTQEGELLQTLKGHQGHVYGVSFSPDGKYLASASRDKKVKLWTLDGKLVDTLKGHKGIVFHVTFSPDGKYLASASRDNTVKLWNFNQDELLKYACNNLKDYLKNNDDASDEERQLCLME
ncbi:WD40 repeat domain-containing protein, partial [Moorena sp. SIO3H5]|uniref:nSTAND1 domain-containing NTPase n=1 Tax=Moorena sp. SIO3H5 TaxID=2607834 RepID=UPI0013B7B9B3